MALVLLAADRDHDKPVLDIALSERNCISLVSKLYTPGSYCRPDCHDVPDEFAYARVHIEPDEYHYASPTREGAPPGPLSPVAQVVVIQVKATMRELVERGLIRAAPPAQSEKKRGAAR